VQAVSSEDCRDADATRLVGVHDGVEETDVVARIQVVDDAFAAGLIRREGGYWCRRLLDHLRGSRINYQNGERFA